MPIALSRLATVGVLTLRGEGEHGRIGRCCRGFQGERRVLPLVAVGQQQGVPLSRLTHNCDLVDRLMKLGLAGIGASDPVHEFQ